MHAHATANLTVQQWGNSLAIRIPAKVARSAHFGIGQPVTITALDTGIMVVPVGDRPLTLAQKLALFDPAQHSGECMATRTVGKEVL